MTDAEILGAILPDALILAGVPWDQSHSVGPALYGYALATDPALAGLARAAITHGADPHGLDYFGDKSYCPGHPGFAFMLGGSIASRAARVCRLPEELGLWKAHNFVEMAAEIIVFRDHPDLAGRLHDILNGSPVLQSAARAIAEAANLERGEVAMALSKLPAYLELIAISPRHLAGKYQFQLRHRHGVQDADLDDLEALVSDCIPMVEPRLQPFLERSRMAVERVLEDYPRLDGHRPVDQPPGQAVIPPVG